VGGLAGLLSAIGLVINEGIAFGALVVGLRISEVITFGVLVELPVL